MKLQVKIYLGLIAVTFLMGITVSVAVADGGLREHEKNPKVVDFWVGGDVYGDEAIEYFEDNTCLTREKKEEIACTWILLSDGRVKVSFSIFGMTKFGFAKINKDIMELGLGDDIHTYSRRGSERELSWRKFHEVHVSPEAVARALLEAAKAGNLELIGDLCDPEGPKELGAQNICFLSGLFPKPKETLPGLNIKSLPTAFENVSLTNLVIVKGSMAEIKIVSEKKDGAIGSSGSFKFVKRDGYWYLYSF